MTGSVSAPLHPGEILREEFMQPHKLSSNALAGHLRVTTARINEISSEKRGITADTALRLARFFSTSAQFWMDLQKQYELETTRREVGARIRQEITPLEDLMIEP